MYLIEAIDEIMMRLEDILDNERQLGIICRNKDYNIDVLCEIENITKMENTIFIEAAEGFGTFSISYKMSVQKTEDEFGTCYLFKTKDSENVELMLLFT